MKKSSMLVLLVILICLLLPNVAFAADSGLEIETMLDTIMKALRGRVAWFVGVGSIIIAAMGWAATEGGSMAQKGFKVAVALAIMFNSAALAAKLYGASEGLGF